MRRGLLILLISTLLPLATASAAEHEKKKGGGETYVQFPTLTASVDKGGGRRGVLTVDAGVDVADAALRERVDQLQPRLRDAYVRFVMTYAAGISPGSLPNPDTIGTALQRQTDEVLGRPGARLLLGTILVN